MKLHLRRPVAGVGHNDADYDVQGCPFYSRWTGMLKRCYNENELKRTPCYRDVEVCEEWKNSFMAFRRWMESQPWEGRELDKDLKGDGTIYSPETCLFVPGWVNSILLKDDDRELPRGVSVDKRSGAFRATLSVDGRQIGAGYFKTVTEAYLAYVQEKMWYIIEKMGAEQELATIVYRKFKTLHPLKYVYCAGKMRGIAEFNFPAFDDASRKLRKQGFVVFNPAERDRRAGFDPFGMSGYEDLGDLGFDLREALAVDTSWICNFADAIYMLPGWSKSTGATAERALAIALGLEVFGAPA